MKVNSGRLQSVSPLPLSPWTTRWKRKQVTVFGKVVVCGCFSFSLFWNNQELY